MGTFGDKFPPVGSVNLFKISDCYRVGMSERKILRLWILRCQVNIINFFLIL